MREKTKLLLERPQRIANKIVFNQAKLEALKDPIMPHSAGYRNTKIITTRKVDIMAEYAVKMDEIEKTMKSLQKEYLCAIEALSAECNKIGDPYGQIIMYRYAAQKGYDEIAELMNYSEGSIYRSRRIAIELLDQITNSM